VGTSREGHRSLRQAGEASARRGVSFGEEAPSEGGLVSGFLFAAVSHGYRELGCRLRRFPLLSYVRNAARLRAAQKGQCRDSPAESGPFSGAPLSGCTVAPILVQIKLLDGYGLSSLAIGRLNRAEILLRMMMRQLRSLAVVG
jgi:hypothetical protein